MLLPGLAHAAARQRSLFGVEASGAGLPLARDWAFMEHPPARTQIGLVVDEAGPSMAVVLDQTRAAATAGFGG
ncbi:hypothetical protein ACN6K5_004566 [Streptomyces violaceoruber]|uniref:hypothetical protein n=1 Tax=Streptomyces TaxID=1883 RepID=UPI00109E8B6B|nr:MULTISPECIES: hypothetical protein [Streptomyces]THA90047.1 hypothetical protein E6R61_21500 [Streptomyces sp. LRa12]WTC46270.1 hypothetical protein OG855_00325 [Streptomyces anthocyanicus]GHA55347.1 hypothetical protein GCM10010391_45360 [Streptomyces anthocyanicus]